jgi:hypothetical protein
MELPANTSPTSSKELEHLGKKQAYVQLFMTLFRFRLVRVRQITVTEEINKVWIFFATVLLTATTSFGAGPSDILGSWKRSSPLR